MDTFRIIRFSERHKKPLSSYLQKTFLHYSDAYIEYCVAMADAKDENEEPTLLVIDGNDKIVGCHMFFNTKAMIYGKVTNVRWGHDSFLDKDFRHKTNFPKVISGIDAFGIGLSKVNKKIQKHYNILFFNGLFNYVILNKKITTSIINRLTKKVELFVAYKEVVAKGMCFELAEKEEVIHIPNHGYWNKDYVDIDFVRDEDFLGNRFFNNKVHRYYVYHSLNNKSVDECYFVVRLISFKGFQALSIVDFRYNLNIPSQLGHILDAAKILAKKNNIGMCFLVSNDSNVSRFYKFNWIKSRIDLYAKGQFKKFKNARILITAADSDVDFLR